MAAFDEVGDIADRMAISTYVFRKDRKRIDEEALSLVAEAGIKRVELMQSDDQEIDIARVEDKKYLRRICENTGVSIASVHAINISFSGFASGGDRRKLMDTCKRQIHNMQEMGGAVWSEHTKKIDEAAMESFQELLRYVEGTGVNIVIENFEDEGTGVEDRMKFIEEMAHPHLGLLLDIGHVRNSTGENPMTMPGGPGSILKMCKGKLYHVHLHGFKEGKDHHPPLCPGDEIQWEELISALWKMKYRGYWLFEPRGMPKHPDALELTAGMRREMAK